MVCAEAETESTVKGKSLDTIVFMFAECLYKRIVNLDTGNAKRLGQRSLLKSLYVQVGSSHRSAVAGNCTNP